MSRPIATRGSSTDIQAERAGDRLGGLAGPDARGADDQVESESQGGQVLREGIRLEAPLRGERTKRVVALPSRRVAGVGMAEEEQLYGVVGHSDAIIPSTAVTLRLRRRAQRQAFKSSIRPDARNTTSSAMFVTRSPMRSV